MMSTIRRTAAFSSFVVGIALAVPASAQESLQQVKDLYASAAYEDALGVLSRIQRPEQQLEIERYRVFCLIALDRTAEAETAIKSILEDDPLYSPDEAAPRVIELFNRVKRQATPELSRALYTQGKSAMDRKDKVEAIQKFEQLLQLTDDAEVRDSVLVSELRLLAAGFLDLARAVPAPQPAPSLAVSNGSTAPPVRPAVITPPVPVRQELPRWIPYVATSKAAEYKGAVKISISADGKVEDAEIVTPTDRQYDRLLLNAARDWVYEPARRDGVPIPSEKIVSIHLRPR